MDDQKNFILAIVLSSFVMLGYWFFFGKPLAEKARIDAEAERARAEQMVEAPVVSAPKIIPREQAIVSGNRVKIDTASLSGSFNTTGTRFDDVRLKNYNATLDEDSETVIMLTPEGSEHAALIFDNWTLFDGPSGIDTPWQLVSGTTLTETSPIVMEYTGNGFSVERTVTADENYLITLSDVVTNTGSTEVILSRKCVSRQHELPYDLTNFFIIQEGPISIIDNKLVDMKYKKLRKERQSTTVGEGGWVGLTDKYWLSAAIAPQGKQITSRFNYREVNDEEIYEASYETAPLTLTAGASIESVGHIYVGAKVRNVLINYEKDIGIMQMERAIDWGAMRILVRPMSWALSKLGQLLGNYGLGILALTLIIKLYKSVFINIDLRHAPFYGYIKDLAARDPLSILNGFGVLPWGPEPLGLTLLAIGPLALLYGATMAMMQSLTVMSSGGGEQAEMMAKMMKYFPWIIMFVLAPFASGLLLYWVWNNILSFIQQYIITRKFKVDTPIDKFYRKITGKPDPAVIE